MKLGIIVIYLVSGENERLLDLHLSQIERYTEVPYTIYASVNRLLPKYRGKLESHPKVKICECPTTNLRRVAEHSFYLEQLVRIAIEDGCSHIVTLHVDSFPVRSNWAEELAGKLSESCVFATMSYGPYTSCLFFQRDFYLKYRPTFLLSEVEHSSEKYKQFFREVRHLPHSGLGYLFKAYSEGLSWYSLAESKKGNIRYISSIYGGLFYHLGTAAYFENELPKHTSIIHIRKWVFRHFWIPIVRRISYKRAQQRVLGKKGFFIFRRPLRWGWKYIGFPMFYKPIYWHERKQLLEDPESYLNYLRTGRRKGK